MYARLISFSGADAEKRESAMQTIRETVIPMLRTYDGFAGYIALYDKEQSRAKAVILWESEETAEAAEKELVERRRQITSGIGLTVESADLYEAPIVELETAQV
jgi:hypothetical protein